MAEDKNAGHDVSVDIDSLRKEAHRMLYEFSVAAGKTTATDTEKSEAETAQHIVDTAGRCMVQRSQCVRDLTRWMRL